MVDLIELDGRISKAIAKGKGIRFSDEELDLLVSVGAVEVLKKAAAIALKAQAEARRLAREQRRAEAAESWKPRQIEPRAPSEEEVSAAARRAARIFRRQRK